MKGENDDLHRWQRCPPSRPLHDLADALSWSKIREHTGVTKTVFTSQLSSEGVPVLISSAVYDFYKQKSHSNKFNPSPEMDIKSILYEGPEISTMQLKLF